jgi:hypothetical protein
MGQLKQAMTIREMHAGGRNRRERENLKTSADGKHR